MRFSSNFTLFEGRDLPAFEDESDLLGVGVDRDIVTVEEIFRLQRMDTVKDIERSFLR